MSLNSKIVKIYSAQVNGLNADLITIEVGYTKQPDEKGFAEIQIVGLPDRIINESKERIFSSIRHLGIKLPNYRFIVNLSPSDIVKNGTHYDLPIAIGILASSGIITDISRQSGFIGELSLDGELLKVNGALLVGELFHNLNFTEIYVPQANADEITLVTNNSISPKNLSEIVTHLNGGFAVSRNEKRIIKKGVTPYPDFKFINGNLITKRALEIAAAGFHNIMLSGVPGSGKSLMAKSFMSIMPEMSESEILEVTKIYSIKGLLTKEIPIITQRPFRSPHHTSSFTSIIGGGKIPLPGEITLAHKGVLFLDELAEFDSKTLETLRQPLEDNLITIARSTKAVTLPAEVLLIAAKNPCKCGYYGDISGKCECTPFSVAQYNAKISGPLIDRFDLKVNVSKVGISEILEANDLSESSESILKRVNDARLMQFNRQGKYNSKLLTSEINIGDIIKRLKLESLITRYVDKYNITTRGLTKVIKVARTIADLANQKEIAEKHVLEALSFRI